jgi:glutamate--cysteine ligase catalytic subunit
MMALTASTPILKGRLADTDARWGVISESVDDRTLAERGRHDPNAPYEDLNANGQRRIYKSRYDSISTYIYQGGVSSFDSKAKGLTNRVLNIYNDIPVPIDEESYQQLRDAGVDPALAQHVSHLFTRDPLVGEFSEIVVSISFPIVLMYYPIQFLRVPFQRLTIRSRPNTGRAFKAQIGMSS